MSTNNPFAHHTNRLFASRGCDIDAALAYAQDVITGMPTEVQAHAMTALMVVVNTAANAFTQATGPSPAQEVAAAWVRELVAQEVAQALDQLDNKVSEHVSGWLSENLDNRMDEWANNSMSFEDACDNRVERWVENNLELGTPISEWMNEYLESHIENAINEMDLVVRTR